MDTISERDARRIFEDFAVCDENNGITVGGYRSYANRRQRFEISRHEDGLHAIIFKNRGWEVLLADDAERIERLYGQMHVTGLDIKLNGRYVFYYVRELRGNEKTTIRTAFDLR